MLRPGRKVTDMFLLACLITFLLISAGEILGSAVLSLAGFPASIDEEVMQRIAQGQLTVQEATGLPDYLSFASLYLSFFGIWIVFILAMAIPPSNRKMLEKLALVHDKRSLKLVAIGALMGFGINSVCVIASVFIGDVSLHFERFEVGPLLLSFFAVFIQSGAEEVSCRLFLYQKLARRYRHPAVAIVISAAFFVLLHAANPGITPIAFAQIMAVGILLSIFIYYYDSLGACIAVHTLWNFTQSIIYGLPNSGAVSLYSVFKLDAAAHGFFFDPVFGVEGSIGGVVLLVLASVCLVLYAKKRNLKPCDLWASNRGAHAREEQ